MAKKALAIKAAVFDLDGTLFLGRTPIPGAIETLRALRDAGTKTLFLTNAGTRTRKGVAEKLVGLGFAAQEREIYCGSYILAMHIRDKHPGKTVFPVGEPGLSEELEKNGIKVDAHGAGADIVAVCLDRTLTYEKLGKAHVLLRKGALFLATNKDHIFPTEKGTMPGAGAIVAALEFSSERTPYVVGKPNPMAFELMMAEHGLKGSETLMVGDRLDTDIAFARNCGMKSALVLTGNSKRADIGDLKPDYVLDSVAQLTEKLGLEKRK
ncbi:HAD-IIA family hydrolase [Candidatus Micrarchaeota archaeon]|nr:HAD-IIA family hydrolase [Candidatus Micrarchaeota archaeon]